MSEFRIIQRVQIDEARWKAFVDKEARPFYNSLSFLDALSPGWEVLTDLGQSFYFPLPVKKRMGLKYLVQPAFCQQLHFLGDVQEDKKKRALNYLLGSFPYINIQVGNLKAGEYAGFECKRASNYILELEGAGSDYSNNLKRSLKKARSLSLNCEESGLQECLALFKSRTLEQKSISVIKDDHLKAIKGLLDDAEADLGYVCLKVTDPQEVLSSACFIIQHKTAYYLFSSNSEASKKTGSSAYLIDSFFRSGHARELEYLDFEGSSFSGLKRFYSGFGAKEDLYLRLRKKAFGLF